MDLSHRYLLPGETTIRGTREAYLMKVHRRVVNQAAVVVAAAACIAPLWLAPVASATYPGHSGTLAYEEEGVDDASGNVAFSGISSIPLGSGANCVSDDGGVSSSAPCTVFRISFSPDGRHIVAQIEGTQDRLEVLDARGGHVRRLRPLTSSDADPAYLPNGTRIVFTGTENNHSNLYEVGVDGTGLRQLTRGGGSWPAPCANGSIAYVNRGTLYLRRPDGRTRTLVRSGARTPDCAPNSRSVIYQTTKRHDRIVNTAGGPSRAVGGRAYDWPTFSPDGTRIGSISQDNFVTVITVGGRTVSRRQPAYPAVAFPAWQPLP